MTWKPKDTEAHAEIERLNKLIEYYESTNYHQQEQIQLLQQNYQENIKKIISLEKEIKVLKKSTLSLQSQQKVDKIASEGIKKKYNLNELHVKELKYELEKLTIERSNDKILIKELTDDLNKNRANKLQLLHENTKLKKQNEILIKKEKNDDDEIIKIRSSLLKNLEELDTIKIKNSNYENTINLQAEEILLLTNEISQLKELIYKLNQDILTNDSLSAEYNHSIDSLQDEISRLRKELIISSNNSNTMSDWYLSREANKISTAIVTTTYSSSDTNGPYSIKRRPYTETGKARIRNKTSSLSDSRSNFNERNSLNNSTGMKLQSKTIELEGSLTSSLTEKSPFSSPMRPGTVLTTLPAISPRPEAISTDGKYKYIELQETADQLKDSLELQIPVGGSKQTVRQEVMKKQAHILDDTPQEDTVTVPAVSPGRVRAPSRAASQKSPSRTPSRAAQSSRMGSRESLQYSGVISAAATPCRPGAPIHRIGSTGSIPHSSSGGGDAEGQMEVKSLASRVGTAATLTPFGNRPNTDQNVETTQSLERSRVLNSVNEIKKCYSMPSTAGNETKSRKKPKNKGDSGKKSLYVSSGLGYKHNAELDKELQTLNKGTAKQIIRNILGDRLDEDGNLVENS